MRRATSRWLGFTIDEPHYFQYSYDGTVDSAEAVARGDLDCDGVTVDYTLNAIYNSGNPTYDVTKPPRAD